MYISDTKHTISHIIIFIYFCVIFLFNHSFVISVNCVFKFSRPYGQRDTAYRRHLVHLRKKEWYEQSVCSLIYVSGKEFPRLPHMNYTYYWYRFILTSLLELIYWTFAYTYVCQTGRIFFLLLMELMPHFLLDSTKNWFMNRNSSRLYITYETEIETIWFYLFVQWQST